MKNILYKLVDIKNENSLSNQMRRKRFEFFKEFISDLKGKIRILDIGGTYLYWKQMGIADNEDFEFTLVNLKKEENLPKNFISLEGDARDLSQFDDNNFDIVFSNSTIEHLGNYDNQHRMASEIRRLAIRYFIQTPNKYFPIEPHFVFPFFQFLPLGFRTFLVQHFSLGNFEKIPDKEKARQTCEEILKKKKKEFSDLFADAEIFEEKFCGLTKSFIAYKK